MPKGVCVCVCVCVSGVCVRCVCEVSFGNASMIAYPVRTPHVGDVPGLFLIDRGRTPGHLNHPMPKQGALCPDGRSFIPIAEGSVWEIELKGSNGRNQVKRLVTCPPGWAMSRDNRYPLEDQCLKCEAGTYLLDQSNFSNCLSCAVGAMCSGGSAVAANAGFWREPDNWTFGSSVNSSQDAEAETQGRRRLLALPSAQASVYRRTSDDETETDADDAENASLAPRRPRKAVVHRCNPGACASANVCLKNYTGPACGLCPLGWAKTSKGCEWCPPDDHPDMALLRGGVLGVGGFLLFIGYIFAAWTPLMGNLPLPKFLISMIMLFMGVNPEADQEEAGDELDEETLHHQYGGHQDMDPEADNGNDGQQDNGNDGQQDGPFPGYAANPETVMQEGVMTDHMRGAAARLDHMTSNGADSTRTHPSSGPEPRPRASSTAGAQASSAAGAHPAVVSVDIDEETGERRPPNNDDAASAADSDSEEAKQKEEERKKEEKAAQAAKPKGIWACLFELRTTWMTCMRFRSQGSNTNYGGMFNAAGALCKKLGMIFGALLKCASGLAPLFKILLIPIKKLASLLKITKKLKEFAEKHELHQHMKIVVSWIQILGSFGKRDRVRAWRRGNVCVCVYVCVCVCVFTRLIASWFLRLERECERFGISGMLLSDSNIRRSGALHPCSLSFARV